MKMSKPRPSGKSRAPKTSAEANRRSRPTAPQGASAPPTISGRWLLTALGIAVIAALFCAWGTLCILFWQGSWQLLYHPVSAVTRTPASVHLEFESVGFATNVSGEPQLRGWWIPAAGEARYTAIYLHGAQGNLGDTVDALVRLHALGVNVFAFDYRGYGQSHFVHPSEVRWREDADSAIRYLTGTRHIAPGALILVGEDLGANLAVETAAAHADLGGVVVENPIESPTKAIYNDPRSRMVPAHLLVGDRWETSGAAANVLIPSLWFCRMAGRDTPEAYRRTPARKMLVWLTKSPDEAKQFNAAMSRWLDQLPAH